MIASIDIGEYLPSLLDADAAPDALAEWATTVSPGPAVIKPLTWLRPDQLSHVGRIDAIAAVEAQLAWLQAVQLHLIAAVAEEPVAPGLEHQRYVREELGCALRLSSQAAEARLFLAETLATRLPHTLAALEHGELTVMHARALVEQTTGLDPETTAALEARVLPNAAGQSLAEFKRSVRRARLAVDARQADQRHAAAMAERRVEVTPADDGMTHLYAFLPADGAQALMNRLTDLADHTCKHDDRTMNQRRADALVQLACSRPDGSSNARPAVQVTVALSTLLGVDDQPGDLAGHGPIPAALARSIAADPTGTWRRLVTDHTGQLVEVGRRTYRPPAGLARHVKARDRSCRFPHCNRPARRADIDHITDWHDFGPTEPDNLHLLCRRHHRLKHQTTWHVRRHRDGSTEWTSPAARRYLKPAACYSTVDPPPPF